MGKKDLNYQLLVAIQNFEEEYKKELSKHESHLDENTYNALYDLGATVKHAFDEIKNILVASEQK